MQLIDRLAHKYLWPFTPLEREILLALESRLSASARTKFHAQLASINKITRLTDGREVNCYRMQFGKIYKEPSIGFENRTTELKLATITFSKAGERKGRKASIFLVRGYFFQIEFDSSPLDIRLSSHVNVRGVEVHSDPTVVPPVQPQTEKRLTSPDILKGWLKDWAQKYTIRDLSEALPDEQRCALMDTEPGPGLPRDYASVAYQTEGFIVENCSVFGMSEQYKVILPYGDFLLIGELGGKGSLGLRFGTHDGLVYYLPYDGGEPENLGNSFKKAVETLLGRPD